jgi:glutamyl-tRNA synthetase
MPPPAPHRPCTRLAPSPTGALHLGNARTFLITWALARTLGWALILRIEDLDTPRVKPGAIDALTDTLRWLGLDWDPPTHGPPDKPLIQSRDLAPYRAAMRALAARGLAYPCELTRAQVEAAASAPQEGAHDVPFPAHLRPPLAGTPLDFDQIQSAALAARGEPANWRFLCPAGPVPVHDRIAGHRAFDPSAIVGDFVLWTKRDQPSYQLAVVVDDHRQGVTHVVRGDDLLDSAARQTLLYRALSLAPLPDHCHLPLVLGPDGRRLAKRHGDTRLDHYRAAGVPPDAVVGLLAHWSIPGHPRAPTTPAEFKARFDPATMPRTPVTFSPEDDRWLRSAAT